MKTQRPLSLVPIFFALLLLHLHPTSIIALIDPTAYAFPVPSPAPAPAAVSAKAPSATTTTNNDTEFIRTSCQRTRYPKVCFNSLYGYASTVQQDPAKLALVAIAVSLSRAKQEAAYFFNLSKEADHGADRRAASAVHDCFSFFHDAVDQMHDSIKQMRIMNGAGSEKSFRFQMSNVQTWMSAALTYEDTCTDGFEYVSEGPIKTDVCNRVSKAEEVTSNALALINSYADKVSTP